MTGRTDAATGRGEPSAQDTGTSAGEDGLAVRLAALSRSLQDVDGPDEVLERVVRGALAVVPGAEEGSVSLVTGRRRVHALAASGPLPRRVDALQDATGQGPCLEVVREHSTVRVSDMATEQRWPAFSAQAAAEGAASMLSCQLYVEDDDLGALNLFARSPGAFTDASEHVALLFCAHAAVAYAAASTRRQLTDALGSREVVGQATGILMERHKVDADRAFALLTRASQSANRKLRDVAEDLTRSGALPGP